MKNLMIMLLSYPDLEMQATVSSARFNFSFILCCCLIVLLQGCTELSDFENQQVQKALNDSLFATTLSRDIEMEIIEDGLLKLRLTGSSAATIQDEKRNITKISGPVHIEIYDDSSRVDTIVDADSVVHRPKLSEFEFFGNVKVKTREGKKLRSGYLSWQRNKDRVSTPEFVIFISPPDSIAANGFFGNTNLTDYTLNEGGGKTVID